MAGLFILYHYPAYYLSGRWLNSNAGGVFCFLFSAEQLVVRISRIFKAICMISARGLAQSDFWMRMILVITHLLFMRYFISYVRGGEIGIGERCKGVLVLFHTVHTVLRNFYSRRFEVTRTSDQEKRAQENALGLEGEGGGLEPNKFKHPALPMSFLLSFCSHRL